MVLSIRREGHIEDSGRFPGLVADKIIRGRSSLKEGQKVQLRPDEVVRAGGDSKVVGDVWCRKVVHLIVEKNSSPERMLKVIILY